MTSIRDLFRPPQPLHWPLERKLQAALLPGTGSDEVFVRSVFAEPLAAIGISSRTPSPLGMRPPAEGYLAALNAAARAANAPILAGGISFGAQVATEWALRHPEQCAGLLLAMPAWTGEPADAPAARAARASAQRVRADGLESALAGSSAGVPAWLAAELDRAWHRHGDDLADALEGAAAHAAPELAQLAELDVPVGVAACTGDPVHPAELAWDWASALPRACVRSVTLELLGTDRSALGRACVLAWLRAGGVEPPTI